MNKRRQAGISPVSVLIFGGIFAFLFVIGARCVPVVNEYFNVKRIIKQVADNTNPETASAAEIRRDFEKRAYIDDIKTVKPTDLQVSKHNGRVVIDVAYQREVPIGGPVNLLFKFATSSEE